MERRNENGKGYKIKYYKGLGTSTSKNSKNISKKSDWFTFNCKKMTKL